MFGHFWGTFSPFPGAAVFVTFISSSCLCVKCSWRVVGQAVDKVSCTEAGQAVWGIKSTLRPSGLLHLSSPKAVGKHLIRR